MADQTWADVGIEIPYHRSGEVDVLCPKCSHTRRHHPREKCLSVNTDSGVWHCHHCHWSGVLKTDRPRYGQPLPRPTYTRPDPMPSDDETPQDPALDWFERRAIPGWVVEDYGIRYGFHYLRDAGKEVPCIQFPYTRGGELVNVKYRATGEKMFGLVAGAERIFFGLDQVPEDADAIVITEGEIDALSIAAAGGYPAISVPNGASSSGNAFEYLTSGEDLLNRVKRVLIGTDMDEPGQRLADELARRIGPEKCFRVVWPEGCKDANDALVQQGVSGVASALADARPYPVAGITAIDDLVGPLELLYETGFDRGRPVGFPNLDALYRVREGLLSIWTGSPGSGKSSVLDNLLVRLADRHGWTIGICSPENFPYERHLAMLCSIYLNLPFNDGPTRRMTLEELRQAERWARDKFAYIYPDEPTLENVLDRAKTLVFRMGIKGLVIDPWNTLDHSRPGKMTETEYISHCLDRMKAFAQRHGVHVWLVAHPTKLRKDEKTGEYPVATPYDIAGSAHFFNRADFCVSVWRNPMNPEIATQVHIQKRRFLETGETGMAEFVYDRATGRIKEAR